MKDAPKKGHSNAHAGQPAVMAQVWTGISDRTLSIAAAAVAVIAVIMGILFVLPVGSTFPIAGYPMDDAWIHLTFAKNLRAFGAYSFFRSEMITSGSSSPLYVFLLAAIGAVIRNDLILTTLIGLASFAASAYLIARLGAVILGGERWLGIVAALVFVLTPRMQAAAVSGVATMLYTALILGAALAYMRRRSVLFFILTGIALWVGPDALVFLAAALLHLLYSHGVARRTGGDPAPENVARRSVVIGVILLAVIVAAYAVFNFSLSGSFFPNTVAARIDWYKNVPGKAYWSSALLYYGSSTGAIFIAFAIAGLVFLAIDVLHRRPAPLLMSYLVVIGTVLAYGLFLPVLLDDGRYLVSTMPFFFLAGIWGIRRSSAALAQLLPLPAVRMVGNAISIALFAAGAIVGLAEWSGARREYVQAVQYVMDRHVAGAEWIASNTPPLAVVATHLPGTFGYIGNRPVLDLTGVVSPEAIPTIGNLKLVTALMRSDKAAYIATLRERLEIVNQTPAFSTDPRIPEVMEIFRYDPAQTHFMPQKSSSLNLQAAALMRQGLNAEALSVLQQSYMTDPYSSRTSTLMGLCQLNLKDTGQAEAFLKQAIDYQRDYTPAMVPLADIAINKKNYLDAYTLLEAAMRVNPSLERARDSYTRLLQRHDEDSLAALGYQTIHITK